MTDERRWENYVDFTRRVSRAHSRWSTGVSLGGGVSLSHYVCDITGTLQLDNTFFYPDAARRTLSDRAPGQRAPNNGQNVVGKGLKNINWVFFWKYFLRVCNRLLARVRVSVFKRARARHGVHTRCALKQVTTQLVTTWVMSLWHHVRVNA